MVLVQTLVRRGFGMLLALAVLSGAHAQTPTLSDPTISRHVQDAIGRDYRLRDSDIEVATSDGVVTLKGVVSTYLDKYSAERIARRTIGVSSVVNSIVVDLLSIDDRKIQADVEHRLSRGPLAELSGVKVAVDDGVVTLSGSVKSWSSARAAERIAREIRGVRSITNDLRAMDPSSDVSDDQLALDVEARLARDAYLAGYPIQIDVKSGVVTLTGELPNLFLKQRTVNQTWSVPGVRQVHDRLITDFQLTLQTLPRLRTDAELAQLVQRELAADPRIAMDGITTHVMHGEVVLSGWVDSILVKRLAGRIARQALGITSVQNLLEVRVGARSDQLIRSELLEDIKSDHLLSGAEIDVVVLDGAVTLRGQVSAHPHRYHATALASRISGVRRIENELQVTLAQARSDVSIRADIVKRIASNAITREFADQVSVAVDGGVVTVDGKVNRYVAALEVLRIANRTDGVRRIENQLEVVRQ